MIPLFKVLMHPLIPDDVAGVLDSGFIGQGDVVDEFEDEFSSFAPGRALLTNSCTSAIHMSLSRIGVGPGDEVITTPLTCIATNAPILALGARPVWADVHRMTGNIDPVSVRARVTERTKAIIGVDWTGRVADYRALRAIGLPVIQDAAHGPLLTGTRDQFGDYICFSFGPIKHLTSGDGGAVVPPADQIAAMRLMRWYGLDRETKKDFRCEQDISLPGLKWHMNDISAAIGLRNLSILRNAVIAHREHARTLSRLIVNPLLILPPFDPSSNYWVFPLLVESDLRDNFKAWMERHGVACSQVHARNDKHTAYHFPSGSLPGLDYFDAHQANLPCGWWMERDDVMHVARIANQFRGHA